MACCKGSETEANFSGNNSSEGGGCASLSSPEACLDFACCSFFSAMAAAA